MTISNNGMISLVCSSSALYNRSHLPHTCKRVDVLHYTLQCISNKKIIGNPPSSPAFVNKLIYFIWCAEKTRIHK